MDSVEAFIGAVLQGGFSVAVAAFLLLRMERELRALREAITLLRHCQTCHLLIEIGRASCRERV